MILEVSSLPFQLCAGVRALHRQNLREDAYVNKGMSVQAINRT